MTTPTQGSHKAFIGRLKLIGAGFALAGVGILRIIGGIQVVRHGNGQPMFSWGLIAGGIICFILAFVPLSWIARAAKTPKSVHHRPN
jgi:hypothetical protein